MAFKERAQKLVSKMTLDEKLSQMRYNAPAIERLEIPAYNWWNECLHGVARSGTATVFPQAIAMAASFDTKLMYEIATAISDEARAKYNEYKKFGDTLIYQGLTHWSPNINIFRDPRWGRGHETYGEDPCLTGKMGTAFIRGLQGNGKYRKLDATIKHYAVHSGPEKGRHSFDSIVSEKDLKETYLWAFKYCIDNADPSAVMGAYNRVNGEAACASKTLLQDILYGEFGFGGYVVSDCGAISDINLHHKITADEAESAALAVNSGCQLNCGKAYEWLSESHRRGLITEETVTEAVEKLFTARYRLGMFDDDCEYDAIPYDILECEKHRELNLRMAHQSIVLLKNDGILPLKTDATNTQAIKVIAVIGPNADDKAVLLGNYNGTPSRYTTFLRGIQNAADENKIRVIYARGCDINDDTVKSWAEQPEREAVIAVQKADIAIVCMGLNPTMEGEEGDAYNGALSGDKRDLEFPPSQQKFYETVQKTAVASKTPIIFVNCTGSAMNLSAQDADCAAVLQAFYPGAEGGTALADILFGKVSPSSKLPVTFYKSVDDLPPFEDYSMENRTYKFFAGPVVYPFGHGLSYSDIQENWLADGKTVAICNKGTYDVNYTVLQYEYIPHKSLCGFAKVFLKGGETKTLKMDGTD